MMLDRQNKDVVPGEPSFSQRQIDVGPDASNQVLFNAVTLFA